MSRSRPQENNNPNPAIRRFEWNGEKGEVRYYDKDAKKNVDVGSDFAFILLDKVGSVGGWHDASGSGIYSNEVKDSTQEVLIVKAFKGGTLAEGLYREIRDHVTSKAIGGQYVAKLYIAFKDNGSLAIGTLALKGAALGAWMDFEKEHRKVLYSKAIRIQGFTEGKKGRITFRVPKLSLKDIDPTSDAQAVALDDTLQAFFDGYFKRTKREQAEDHTDEVPPPDDEPTTSGPDYDDDIPF